MSSLPLGQIITTEQHKDAIHVAVAPVVAGEWLAPGAHIRLAASGQAVNAPQSETIGIVDPFLKQHVTIGQRFWLFLYPGTITSLRHDWTHPAFESLKAVEPTASELERGKSEAWLRSFCERHDTDYEVMMRAAADWVDSQERGAFGAYLCDGGKYEGESVPDEFWVHYERVKGVAVAEEHRGSFFTCSC